MKLHDPDIELPAERLKFVPHPGRKILQSNDDFIKLILVKQPFQVAAGTEHIQSIHVEAAQ